MREILPELLSRQVDPVPRFFETCPKTAEFGRPQIPLMLSLYPGSFESNESG